MRKTKCMGAVDTMRFCGAGCSSWDIHTFPEICGQRKSALTCGLILEVVRFGSVICQGLSTTALLFVLKRITDHTLYLLVVRAI